MDADPTERPNPMLELVDALESDQRVDPLLARVEPAAAAVGRSAAAPLLRGDPIGHALHPLMTDIPLGCWVAAGLLDLLGGRTGRPAAQRLVALGLVASVPTVMSGLVELDGIDDRRNARVAAVHGLGNAVVACCYTASWRARRRDHHVRGVLWGFVGGLGAVATGYLGGHLSFARSVGTGERGVAPSARRAQAGDGPSAGGVPPTEESPSRGLESTAPG
jgi:uncharacterized membrane protein